MKRKAKERAEHNRYLRKELARIRKERDRSHQARQETQDRLRQHEAQAPGLVVHHKVDLVWLALRLFLEVRIRFRAVSRVLRLLAEACGITQAPGPQTVLNGVTRLAMVRCDAARLLRGLPLRAAPCSHGLIWMIARSIGLGTGKMLAVLACDAHHHQRAPDALALDRVHCLGVAVADAWTGDPIAAGLGRLIAQMGRPAAARKDGGGDVHKAVAGLGEHGLASPCLDDISHAVAGMRKRSYHDPPTFATFGSACGRLSGQLQPTMLACVAPPNVRTKARLMHGHRFCTWAARVLKLSPAGGAKSGST